MLDETKVRKKKDFVKYPRSLEKMRHYRLRLFLKNYNGIMKIIMHQIINISEH